MIISIQLLRFLAASLVLVHHIFVILGLEGSLGYRGVDIFFLTLIISYISTYYFDMPIRKN